jgi:hypothetical protein
MVGGAVNSAVPNHQQTMPRSALTEPPREDAPVSPDAGYEQTAPVEPAPSAAFVELLLPKNTRTPPSTSPNGDAPPTSLVPFSPVAMAEPPTEAATLSQEMDHGHTEDAEISEHSVAGNMVSEESTPAKTLYPPPVAPTQTYQPPAPSLSASPVTKSPSAVSALASKFKRRSWHPSEHARASAPTSPVTNGPRKIHRSASVASSGASSPCSANSATVQVPQPGTSAYVKKSDHRRQQSDPKYIRFMSAISENQNQKEPERYVGYPGLVSHMAETQNLIFRRFDSVHIRLLLYLQDQISQLETQLRNLDERNSEERGMHNGTFREDADQVRVEIMESLRRLVGEYDTMILAFSRMQESKASEKAVERLKDWLRNYSVAPIGRRSLPQRGAIARDELEWVEKADDLTNLSTIPAASNGAGKQSTLTRLFPGRKRS